jgi:DNA-directed RNA polymerase subunit M
MLVGGADRPETQERSEEKQETPAFRGGRARKLGSKKPGVSFCPKCGSTNVFWASGLPQLWSVWECRNCGYRGAFVLRDGKLAEKLSHDYKRKTGRT